MDDSIIHFFMHIFSKRVLRGRLSPNFLGGEMKSRSQRVPFCILKRASLTVEAALVLPLFFFSTICLISIMNMYGNTLERNMRLRDTAMTLSLAASLSEDSSYIDLNVPYRFVPMFLPGGSPGVLINCRAYVKPWNGRDTSDHYYLNSKSAGDYVYVTENGSVYHTKADCSYIDITAESVSLSTARSSRNYYGDKYTSCDHCHGDSSTGQVYITKYSNHYHSNENCSGLTRDVKMVDSNTLGGMHKCSRC